MDAELERLFDEALGRAQGRFGIEVTPAAVAIIRTSIEAMATDPPPWRVPEGAELRTCQIRAIEHLPDILLFLLRTRGERTVGAFQLLGAAPQLMGLYFMFAYPP